MHIPQNMQIYASSPYSGFTFAIWVTRHLAEEAKGPSATPTTITMSPLLAKLGIDDVSDHGIHILASSYLKYKTQHFHHLLLEGSEVYNLHEE